MIFEGLFWRTVREMGSEQVEGKFRISMHVKTP